MFKSEPTSVSEHQLDRVTRIANLFEPLFIPGFVATLCLRPRSRFTGADNACSDLGTIRRFAAIAKRADCLPALFTLRGETWLELDSRCGCFSRC